MRDKMSLAPIFNEKGICYILSYLDVKIKILEIGWNNISKLKHPELENKFWELTKTLIKPTLVRQSKKDKQVYLYYLKLNKKYFCAICKHYNNKEGFLITAYYTYKPEGAKKIWPKKK